MQRPDKNQKIILIVDDDVSNIKLLEAMLRPAGYFTCGYSDEKEALEEVRHIDPDLILLDIMMPGIDGFEVCERLKSDERTRAIPVVMVTALKGKEHTVRAMEVGADDFLNKPVDRIELLVRVKSLLRIKSYYDEINRSCRQIARKNNELEALQKAKDSLTHMIVHDLNNPITAISGNLQVMMKAAGSDRSVQMKRLESCLRYCFEMNELVRGLLDINKMEKGKLELHTRPSNVIDWTQEVVEQFESEAAAKGISVSVRAIDRIPAISLDSRLLRRVLANLLGNAVRHTPGRGRISVEVSWEAQSASLRFNVTDTGPGIAAEYHQKIFNKFEQINLKKAGVKVGASGLGLTFCKMAVEAHGGKIWVESNGGRPGACFSFVIPGAAHAAEPCTSLSSR